MSLHLQRINCFAASMVISIVLISPLVFCNENVSIFDEKDSNKSAQLALTLPGTKWCGPGDSASNETDLGHYKETDACCRAHDNCDDIIYSGETKHGLENPDLFTRLHCKCEKQFQYCLRKANSTLASAIGNTYTTARRYCFKLEHPIRKCIKWEEGWLLKRCIKYRLNRKEPKEWQWFDIPFYSYHK